MVDHRADIINIDVSVVGCTAGIASHELSSGIDVPALLTPIDASTPGAQQHVAQRFTPNDNVVFQATKREGMLNETICDVGLYMYDCIRPWNAVSGAALTTPP